MNKIYSIIYNKCTQTYVAVAENVNKKRTTSSTTATNSVKQKTCISRLKILHISLSVIGMLNMNNVYASFFNTDPTGSTAYGVSSGSSSIAIGAGDTPLEKALAQGSYSLAVGANAQAVGTSSVAIGNNSNAFGNNSISMGASNAVGTKSTGIGFNANAYGSNGVAMGVNAQARGDSSVAIGTGRNNINGQRTSAGLQSVALGYTARADGNSAVAIGTYTSAGNDSVAMGNGADATQTNTIAIGKNAYAGVEAIHIGSTIVRGNDSNLTGAFRRGSTLIGNEAVGQGLYSTVIGNHSQVLANEKVLATGLFGRQFVAQNAFTNILGAYNTVGDTATNKTFNGVAVTVVGAANKVKESNGAFIAGYGNSVTNSYKDSIDVSGIVSSSLVDNTAALADILADSKTELGQTGVIGAVNKLDNSSNTLVMGMRNDVNLTSKSSVMGFTQTAQNLSYTSVSGADSTVKNTSHVFTSGTNNTITNAADVIAMGNNMVVGSATTSAKNSILLGNNIDFASKADMANAVSIGDYSRANTGAVAVGVTAQALGVDSIAIGRDAIATGSMAMGASSRAGNGGAAFGDGAIATYLNGVNTAGTVAGAAFGQNAQADVSGAVALGTSAVVSEANSVALGAYSTTTKAVPTASATIQGITYQFAGAAPVGVVSVGSIGNERQIQNVAAGQVSSSSTDAINGSQLYALSQKVNASDIHFVSINSKDASKANYGNDGASGEDAIAIGVGTTVAGSNAVALGSSATASHANSIAIGNKTKANQTNAIAIGNGSAALGDRDVIIGTNTIGPADGLSSSAAVGIGSNIQFDATSKNGRIEAVAVGEGVIVQDYGTGLGAQAVAAINSTAVGTYAKANGVGSMALGSGNNSTGKNPTVAAAKDSIAIGNNAQTAVGAIGSIALGVDATATVSNSVALGFASTTTAANATNITGTAGQVAVGVVSVGSAGKERQIQNVAAGRVDARSTDAINGSQLYATNSIVNQNITNITELQKGWTLASNNNATTEQITAGETVNFNQGNNIAITQTGNSISIATTPMVNFDQVTVGGVVINKTTGINAGNTVISNVAAGSALTDAVNVSQLQTAIANSSSNWDLVVNSDPARSIGKGSKIEFKDGNNIAITQSGNAISIATTPMVNFDQVTVGGVVINKTTGINAGNTVISNVAPGVKGTDAVNIDQLEAVQVTAGKGWNLQSNGDAATQVKPGDTVDIGTKAGENNIKVTRNGNTIDFELNKNLDLGSTGSVKMGDLTINNGGLSIVNGPSITIAGIDAGGKTITNVAPGKNGTDAVNVDQLEAVQTTAGKGWNLQTDGDKATQVKPGDTVNIGVADGEKNIKVSRNGNTVDFELNKNLDLGATGSIVMGDVLVNGKGLTINNGPSMTVDGINAGNKTITNVAAGTALTDAVNLSQLNQAIAGAKYAGLHVQNGSDTILPNESLNIVGKDGTTVTYDKDSNTYTVSSKTGGTGTGSMDDWNVTGKDGKGGSVSVPITDGKNVEFAAGSKNVTVTPTQTATGAQVKVDIARDLDLSSVTTKNADGSSTVVNGNGVTIKGKDGKNGASITQSGIDAGNQTITNVAAGRNDTDAVNVSQLKEVNNNITNLGSRINDVEDNANAGTAAAMAMANLPQPAYAGEGGMSLGVGTYQGESGYAVGYSAISENGNWVFKASATGNSQGKFGAGAGVFFKMH